MPVECLSFGLRMGPAWCMREGCFALTLQYEGARFKNSRLKRGHSKSHRHGHCERAPCQDSVQMLSQLNRRDIFEVQWRILDICKVMAA